MAEKDARLYIFKIYRNNSEFQQRFRRILRKILNYYGTFFPMKLRKRVSSILNPWVTLVESHLEGDDIPYFHFKLPDYVFALAITRDDLVPLVRQFRIPSGKITLELPAGLVENDHSPLSTASRELKEETGVDSFGAVMEMPKMTLDSGRLENSTYGFIFFDATITNSQLQLPELETIWIAKRELIDLAISGKIDHLGQVALILWAANAGYLN